MEYGAGASPDDAQVEPDPEAPFGRRADGTPKRGPGGRPPKGSTGASGARRPTGRAGRARTRLTGLMGGERATAPPPPKVKPKAGTDDRDYTDGIRSALTLIALPLRRASPLDAAAVLMHAEPIARAGNELAKQIPQVGEWCDRVLTAGPWTGLAMALATVGAQVAENHGWLPSNVTAAFGAVPRQALAAELAFREGGARHDQRMAAESRTAAEDYVDASLREAATAARRTEDQAPAEGHTVAEDEHAPPIDHHVVV